MIKLFCGKRGSGKSKTLIDLANEKVNELKGNSVYIDDDKKRMFMLDSKIRFISMDDYPVKGYCEFKGFICGIVSSDYDIEDIYVDGFGEIVNNNNYDGLKLYLSALEDISKEYAVNVYINIHKDPSEIPSFIQKYVA
ncbi:MAG: hypothetical protein ACRDD2_10910 [Sarcina sp.]